VCSPAPQTLCLFLSKYIEMCLFIHKNIATGTYKTKALGSRLGSLYYNSIITLATLPRSRHDQPEYIIDLINNIYYDSKPTGKDSAFNSESDWPPPMCVC
jgi:hypothetical protein